MIKFFFAFFGRSPIGQIVGATSIGVVLAFVAYAKLHNEATLGQTLLIGAFIGGLSGCLLTSVRLTFGVPFLLLGLAALYTAVVDQDPRAPVGFLYVVSGLFAIPGLYLVVTGWRQLRAKSKMPGPLEL